MLGVYGDGDGRDRRKGIHSLVSHLLCAEERQRILFTHNEPEFSSLPPGQLLELLQVAHMVDLCAQLGAARVARSLEVQQPRRLLKRTS